STLHRFGCRLPEQGTAATTYGTRQRNRAHHWWTPKLSPNPQTPKDWKRNPELGTRNSELTAMTLLLTSRWRRQATKAPRAATETKDEDEEPAYKPLDWKLVGRLA